HELPALPYAAQSGRQRGDRELRDRTLSQPAPVDPAQRSLSCACARDREQPNRVGDIPELLADGGPQITIVQSDRKLFWSVQRRRDPRAAWQAQRLHRRRRGRRRFRLSVWLGHTALEP